MRKATHGPILISKYELTGDGWTIMLDNHVSSMAHGNKHSESAQHWCHSTLWIHRGWPQHDVETAHVGPVLIYPPVAACCLLLVGCCGPSVHLPLLLTNPLSCFFPRRNLDGCPTRWMPWSGPVANIRMRWRCFGMTRWAPGVRTVIPGSALGILGPLFLDSLGGGMIMGGFQVIH